MELKDLSTVNYHPTQEKIVNILRTRTMNVTSDTYFRGITAFYLAQMASSMRARIVTPHRGTIPINVFVCALGESGMGKGYSMNIIESEIVSGFSRIFTKQTLPEIALQSMTETARTIAVYNDTNEDSELSILSTEYENCGAMPYTFDSGTGPAYKQIRTKAQIAKCGALNLICDEIGSNLLENAELFKVNLEAYDMGKIRQKITKNSSESKRSTDREDPVPSNMLVFGTPSALFNGGIEEKTFLEWLQAGYGRRFLFAWGSKSESSQMDAEELFSKLTAQDTDQDTNKLAILFESLADPVNYGKDIPLSKNVTLINLQYQLNCEALAEEISVFEPIRRAELQHRYFKTAKIAGAYAFIDQTSEVTEDQMYAAIKLVEDCGVAFNKMMNQDKNYVRLAKYIAAVTTEVTYADLTQDLPFFSGSKSHKEDMVSLARAWGSRHHIVIKKYFEDGFDILKGETLKETSLEQIIFSVSDHEAYNYNSSTDVKLTTWTDLHKVVQQGGLHWCNHNFHKNHRNEENATGPFNLIILDVDGECTLEIAKDLLKDYSAMFYTTKRHTDKVNRFRIVMPISYELKLSAGEYKEFMHNIFEWLPFGVDTGTGQRCKKWLTHPGHYEYIEGDLLDPTQFIPKTTSNEKRIAEQQNLGDMNKVESWFARSIGEGNRNNTLSKFAFMLFDTGMSPDAVETAVYAFNAKLANGLTKEELQNTVIKSLWGKAHATNRI